MILLYAHCEFGLVYNQAISMAVIFVTSTVDKSTIRLQALRRAVPVRLWQLQFAGSALSAAFVISNLSLLLIVIVS